MRRLLCLSTALAAVTPAVAQDASFNSSEDVIVVTAQKREQAITDVPLAITAFGQETLDDLGVQQFDDLADFVPGLEVQEQSANNPGFVIRGITSDSGEATIEPRVAIFQDGVPISRSRGSFVELFDSQVEVVRGPQPTLFGRSALIGAINIRANAPELGETAGYAKLGAGNLNYRIVEGMVNLPLGERAAFRVAGRYKERDGYIENLLGEDLNGFGTAAYRASLLVEPTDALSVQLIGNYQEDDNPGTSFKSGLFRPVSEDGSVVAQIGPSQPAALSSFGGLEGGRDLGLEREVYGITALVDYQISEGVSFSSVTNWREFDSSEVFDPDGFGIELLAFAENATGEQFFQEFRVNFEGLNGFSGFIGASVFDEEGAQNVPLYFGEGAFVAFTQGLLTQFPVGDGTFLATNAMAPPAIPVAPGVFAPLGYASEEFTNYGETTSYDVFADATYQVTDRLALTAGLRFTADEKKAGYSADLIGEPSILAGGTGAGLVIGGAAFNDNDPIYAEESFSGVTYRVAGQYDLSDDLTVFANYGHGRRPEVFAYTNVPSEVGLSEDNFSEVEAEETDAFDIGIKGDILQGLVSIDLTAYYYEYTNFQTSVQQGESVVTVNGGNASGPGFEAAVGFAASESLGFFATYAFNGVEFDDEDDDGNPQLRAGNRFRLAPENAFTLAADFTHECRCGTLQVVPSYTYRSEIFFDDDNDIPYDPTLDPSVPQLQAPSSLRPNGDLVQDEVEDGYGLLDLRVFFTPAYDESFEIELFVENLTDEEFLLDAGNTGDGFGIPTFIAGPGRMMGATVRKSF